MAKVTFLLGLGGSGKTPLSEQLKAETGAEVFESLIHNKTCPALIQCLREGKDCIVEEIMYCIPSYRDQIMQCLSQVTGLQVQWICFENDLGSANWNVTHRTYKGDPEGHRQFNEQVHPHYVYPEGAEIRPITRIAL